MRADDCSIKIPLIFTSYSPMQSFQMFILTDLVLFSETLQHFGKDKTSAICQWLHNYVPYDVSGHQCTTCTVAVLKACSRLYTSACIAHFVMFTQRNHLTIEGIFAAKGHMTVPGLFHPEGKHLRLPYQS